MSARYVVVAPDGNIVEDAADVQGARRAAESLVERFGGELSVAVRTVSLDVIGTVRTCACGEPEWKMAP